MTHIWKYPINIGSTSLAVPMVRPIHVGVDPAGDPCVWIEIDPEGPDGRIVVTLIGTGHPIPEDAGEHFVSFTHGPFVWHAYIAGAGVTL